MKNNKVVILFNKLSENPQADELDVLTQVNLVADTLKELGYVISEVPFSFNINEAIKQIKEIDPCFVFNLVESIDNKGELCYISPAILNYLQIPYSGVHLEGMFITTNKLLTKINLKSNGIPTADWIELNELKKIDPSVRYILKPIWEDASIGLDFDSVFHGDDKVYIEKLKNVDRNKFFIEKYIEGREFNISVIGGKNGPEVMPHAEMQFINFPEDKPKILGYSAKWVEDTFEHERTKRTFLFNENDKVLLDKLSEICLQCWKVFNLRGYVRIDFRVDNENNPYVLEVNANPCLSPDGGLYAAIQQKGYSFKQVMEKVIEDVFIQ
ncbi:MAG: ATP-grasp domain-containing protein [Bacteroidales bacterium]